MIVVVGMSGGVDSSVAALLLKRQGHDVVGLFMHNWEEKDAEGVCTATQDYEDVARVAAKLDIPYYSVNFSREYYDRVFRYFLDEYAAGRTPNPDVLCNREIKFGPFLDHAKKLGADKIATGHYCGVRPYEAAAARENVAQAAGGCNRGGETEADGCGASIPQAAGRSRRGILTRAKDAGKDQTYFLNQVTGEQLADVLFPLAGLDKREVREIAEREGLATAKKKDSTGICFIGERNFRKFLQNYLPNCEGAIEDMDGRVVGRHVGLMYYTLGQRKGLGLGGDAATDGGRWFVVAKDLARNVLVVSCGDETPLMSSALATEGFNWIAPPPAQEFACLAQVRYRQPPQAALVTVGENGVGVRFARPQRAVTEGQYCVLYAGADYGDVCYGGGKIVAVGD